VRREPAGARWTRRSGPRIEDDTMRMQCRNVFIQLRPHLPRSCVHVGLPALRSKVPRTLCSCCQMRAEVRITMKYIVSLPHGECSCSPRGAVIKM
jgi:hypothetical protein